MLRQRDRQAEQAAKTAARLELLLNEEPGSVPGLYVALCVFIHVCVVCAQVRGGRGAGENVPLPATRDGCCCASGQPAPLL